MRLGMQILKMEIPSDCAKIGSEIQPRLRLTYTLPKRIRQCARFSKSLKLVGQRTIAKGVLMSPVQRDYEQEQEHGAQCAYGPAKSAPNFQTNLLYSLRHDILPTSSI